MTVDEMKEKKRQLGYSHEKLAELSGVPLGTVQKIFGGFTKAPRYKTLQSLEKVFAEAEQKEDLSTGAYVPGKQNVMMVHEPAAAYHTDGRKDQGGYTTKDYFALPEDARTELIDGVFYDMVSPSVIHQLIAGQIFVQLNVFLRRKKRPVCHALRRWTYSWTVMTGRWYSRMYLLSVTGRRLGNLGYSGRRIL